MDPQQLRFPTPTKGSSKTKSPIKLVVTSSPFFKLTRLIQGLWPTHMSEFILNYQPPCTTITNDFTTSLPPVRPPPRHVL